MTAVSTVKITTIVMTVRTARALKSVKNVKHGAEVISMARTLLKIYKSHQFVIEVSTVRSVIIGRC